MTQDFDSHGPKRDLNKKKLLNSITSCLPWKTFDVIGLILQRSCMKVYSRHLRIISYIKQVTHFVFIHSTWTQGDGSFKREHDLHWWNIKDSILNCRASNRISKSKNKFWSLCKQKTRTYKQFRWSSLTIFLSTNLPTSYTVELILV